MVTGLKLMIVLARLNACAIQRKGGTFLQIIKSDVIEVSLKSKDADTGDAVLSRSVADVGEHFF